MDLIYSMPGQPERLFLNIIHACPNRCYFCVDFVGEKFFGFDLKNGRVKGSKDLVRAVLEYESLSRIREIWFCGIGEPLLLYDVVVDAAKILRRELGQEVRLGLNTSGTYFKHDKRVDFAAAFNIVQVSLNAENEKTYDAICRPRFKGAFQTVLEFLRSLNAFLEENASETSVELSVMDCSKAKYLPAGERQRVDVPRPDIAACRQIAEGFGWPLKVKPLLDTNFAATSWVHSFHGRRS